VVQCRADLPAKERKFLTDALRAVAKRFEQIADKIDNPGNAGGPLLDSAGRLIGASAGIGVAIPVDVVKGQLIRDGRVPVPGIGIIAASEDEAIRLSIDGIIILRTLPQSAAAKAGLEGAESDGSAVQDVITVLHSLHLQVAGYHSRLGWWMAHFFNGLTRIPPLNNTLFLENVFVAIGISPNSASALAKPVLGARPKDPA
jgi:hypothetical protein